MIQSNQMAGLRAKAELAGARYVLNNLAHPTLLTDWAIAGCANSLAVKLRQDLGLSQQQKTQIADAFVRGAKEAKHG